MIINETINGELRLRYDAKHQLIELLDMGPLSIQYMHPHQAEALIETLQRLVTESREPTMWRQP